MDLDSVADELYGVSPDDFIGRRKDLVAQARQAGERELAKQIGQLRRPTRTGWLVNVLARAEFDAVEALLDLGQALAQAQQRGSGADLRRLSQERRTAVDALAKRALELGRDHDYEPPEAARQEVAQTLQAALGDPETADLVRRGQLTQALTYGGFGPTDLTAALAASLPSREKSAADHGAAPEAPEPATTEQDAERDAAAEQDRERRKAAEQAASAAQTAWEQAQDELAAGEAEAEQGTQAADELADRVEQLRSQLHETEEAERAAREAGRATRKRLTELRRAAAVAEQAAADAAAVAAG